MSAANDAPQERTLQYQDELPSLPLPSLEDTLERYIKSCEPLLTAQELEHTKAVCHDFLHGVGPQLQAILQERADSERNWLEEWWETFAYLQPRYPSAVNINWFGVLPGNWGPRDMSQCESAAIFTIAILKFRTNLLAEKYPVEKMMGRPLCMHTYTRMFNTCIIPGEDCDELVSYPHDSKYIIALRNNCIWTVQVLDDDGNALPLADILYQFEQVREEATGLFDLERYPPVSVLTSENRTNWAKAREHIMTLDDMNKESFELVQKALFCIALDENSAATYDDIARNALLGDGRNRWYDKPVTLIIHENARCGLNGQHVWADALVVIRLFDYCIKYVNENFKSKFADRTKLKPTLALKPKRLNWVLDNAALTAIERASAAIGKLIHASDLHTLQFHHYGSSFLKRYKLTPDFYMQMAIQLAHYKMHKHVPAIYETAHSRLFYHGRTETIRSLSNKSLAFVKTMESDASVTEKWDALKLAISTHKEQLKRCLTGEGVDRHLMGLQIVAEMSGVTPKPSLFTDKAFDVSKKFLISTSNVSGGPGASPIWGGFSAMYNEGYGVCYALHDDRINVSVSAYHVCPDTDAAKLKRHLETALLDMADLCLSRNVIYVGSAKILTHQSQPSFDSLNRSLASDGVPAAAARALGDAGARHACVFNVNSTCGLLWYVLCRYLCPAPCEAKLLPRDMESLEDCVCHGHAAKLHGNSYDETPRRAGIFRCPEGAAAKVLHPKSFADCACVSGFSRDDTHKTCSSEDFRCMGRYQRKEDVVKVESIADCNCQVPYTKDEATGECELRDCPRAGNYVEKSRRQAVTSLVDCACMEPFVKNDQSGECLLGEPFQCPPHSSPAKNTRAKSFADCHCEWGFVKNAMDECERESAVYICPQDSMKRPGIPIGVRPQGFFDCECVQEGVLYRRNDFMQSCDEISPDGSAAKRQTPFECPPFAKPLAAIPHSVEQCECLEGYGWKTPEMVCVRMSTYKCPLHSYKFVDEKPVEETFDDCACTSGYYRDESLQKCIEWFLTNDNGCPKFSFLKHWPLQSKANCQCIYGFKEAIAEDDEFPGDDEATANKALLRQQRRSKKKPAQECNASPSMTMDDKFTFSECPQNAFATNWPLSGLDECSCLFGFNVAPISDEDLDHGDGELFQCLPSQEVDADEQALACRPPMVMNRFNGLCRLPLEEVRASPEMGAKSQGTVQFKGIEYDYVLTDENVMVTQGDIAIGELLTWDTASGAPTEDHRVLHGYYNSERDHRWKDAEMCFQVDVGARMFDRMVRDAMAHITTVTGFKFRACRGNRCRDDQHCSHDFVNVQATPSSCYSYIGRIGGQQPLGVSGQCGRGNVIHVLLHAVGLHHTIDRVDRDDHVRIAWECVPEPKRTNFIIEDANATRAASQDVPYDFFSVMHHPSDAFVHSSGIAGGNGKEPPSWCQSVFPIIADVDERLDVLGTMGQRELLAVTDIHAVWKLYPALQDQEKPPTYESVQVDATDDGDVDTNGNGDAQPRPAAQNVFESRLHTQEDVTDANNGDASLSLRDKRAGRSGSRFSQRAASFIGAIVTLFGFGAFVAFAVAEIRKRTLRGSDAYYAESLLTDKSLYD